MKIIVKAKPGSKEDKVEKISDNEFIVYVKAFPIAGRANDSIIRLLADYFNKKPYLLTIVSGHFSRIKVIEVL